MNRILGGALLAAAHRRGGHAFTPTDIAGLQLWLKTPIGGVADGGVVGSWPDSSGNGRTATQSGALRPIYKTNIKNGWDAVQFNPVEYMSGSLTLSQPMTVFAVVQHRTTGTDYQFILDGASNRVVLARLSTASEGFDAYAGADAIVAQAQDTNWKYLAAVVNSTSSVVSINGVATTGLDAGTNSLGSTYYLGCFGPTPGLYPMDGYIAEFFIYDTALNTTNRQLVEAYLAAKYAI